MGILDKLKLTQDKKEIQATFSPQKKILVVDDEESLATSMSLILKSAGYETLTAPNGEIGLNLAISEKPDLILLDLQMPVMDGNTMLHKLRQIPELKNLPVIVLTNAGTSDNIRDTKFYSHATDFLIKSNVSPEEIISKARTIIG